MIDETNISQEKYIYYQKRAEKVIENLQKRNMNGYFAPNRAEALSIVMDMIPPGALVARGDSITLEQIGLLTAISKRNENTLINPFQADENGVFPPMEDRIQMIRESFFSDIFITGTNAVTLDGKLVNIDGFGNRVAAMIHGPSKVMLIAGANKIVKDVEEGLNRIHQYAAPINAQRHYLKHNWKDFGNMPCAKTGICVDCKSDMRICNYTVIIDGAMPRHKGRINVVLVGEELGI
jgi:hypothetical protein